jgi:hypothetical protein
MTVIKEQPDYLAYQLRLWRVCDGGRVAWRVSLKSAKTREGRGFASLDDLFDFLRQQAGVSPGPGGDEPLPNPRSHLHQHCPNPS